MSSIKIRTKRQADTTQIRTLIAHPMETGLNSDSKTKKTIAAHFIQQLTVRHNDTIIVTTDLASGISRNPYFSFEMKGGEPGDKITIQWTDNQGNSDSQDTLIQ